MGNLKELQNGPLAQGLECSISEYGCCHNDVYGCNSVFVTDSRSVDIVVAHDFEESIH